ncbi:MAG: hypothetical protein ACIALR_04220 [Blastopirellula sp. JB062]
MNAVGELYANPAEQERQRHARIRARAARILTAIQYAENVCKTPDGRRVEPSFAARAGRVWDNCEADGLEVSGAIESLLDTIRTIAERGGFQVSPGAYFNSVFGKKIRAAGGEWGGK